MLRWIIFLTCLLAVTMNTSTTFAAQRRIALVIGNSTYEHVGRLRNPQNDANLVARTLHSLGFALVGGGARLDLDKASFDKAIETFGQSISGADVAFFYYAGHGVQVGGENWLVPIDANPTRLQDLDFQMINARLVLRQMEGANTHLNIVILDACRNNPFQGRGLRDLQAGLAEMTVPNGTIISYSTQPDSVAQDGEGADSPYTMALADKIRQPGVEILKAFNDTGLVVQRMTGGAQRPWIESSPIDGDFFLAGLGVSVPANPKGTHTTLSPPTPQLTVLDVWVVGDPQTGLLPNAEVPSQVADALARFGATEKIKPITAPEFVSKLTEAKSRNTLPDVIVLNDSLLTGSGGDTALGHIAGIESLTTISSQFGRFSILEAESMVPGFKLHYLNRSSTKYEIARNFVRRQPSCAQLVGNGEVENNTYGTEGPISAAFNVASAIYRRSSVDFSRFVEPGIFYNSARLIPLRVPADEPYGIAALTSCMLRAGDILAGYIVIRTGNDDASSQVPIFMIARFVPSTGWLVSIIPQIFYPDDMATFLERFRQLQKRVKGPPDFPPPPTLIAPADGANTNHSGLVDLIWRSNTETGIIADIIEFGYPYYKGMSHISLRFRDDSSGALSHISVSARGADGDMWRVWSISSTGDMTPSETRRFTSR